MWCLITTMTMNSSLRSWLFGSKGPILPLTAVAATRPVQTQAAPVEKPANRLAPDRLADTAEKGQMVPAYYIQVRGAAMV
jgi:hypothetical protein